MNLKIDGAGMNEVLPVKMTAVLRDPALVRPEQLPQRIDAMDYLESFLSRHDSHEKHVSFEAACARYVQLDAVNLSLYESIREAVLQKQGPAVLRKWLRLFHEQDNAPPVSGYAYDYHDALLSGILQLEEPSFPVAPLSDDMVFYQPTPALHIFEMIDRLELAEHDVLVDLGSGLGHVPITAAICSDARCIGIEWEAAYVGTAQRCARDLHVDTALFIRGDAREVDFSTGTVFYLYTPFTGELLRAVLDKLRSEAISRRIRLCTLGPCTQVLAAEPWLKADMPLREDRVVIFRSSP